MILIVVITGLNLAGPATAQDAAGGRLDLAQQSSYVTADGSMSLVLDWAGPPDPALEFVVTIHGRLTNESDVDGPPGDVLNRTEPVRLIDLPRNEVGQLVAEIPIRSFTPGNEGENRVYIKDAGVYPITAEVRGPEGPVSSLVTHLIRLPTETAEAGLLPISLVLVVSSADGLTLPEAVTLLAKHPKVALTTLLDSGILTQLNGDPELADQFRQALDGRPVLAMPRLDLDPSALAEIDQGQLYQSNIEQTRRDLDALGLSTPLDVLPVDGPLTIEGARLLLDLGIELVLDVGSAPRAEGFLEVDGSTLRVLQIDEQLRDRSPSETGAIIRAHQLLARLAIRFETDRSRVVLGGAGSANASVAGLDVVLSGIDQLGLLEAVTLTAQVAESFPIRPSERSAQDLRSVADDIAAATSALSTYRSFFVAGGLSPTTLHDDLLASLSRDLNPDNRRRAIESVADATSDALDVIELPENQSVTLAAQTSPIPITIDNRSAGTRTIMLRFASDKLDVVGSDQPFDVAPGTSSIDIQVVARSVGLSPLDVIVLTPDGSHELARTRFQVRSTAVPGRGMLLSSTGLALLLGWWANSIRKTRRVEPRG